VNSPDDTLFGERLHPKDTLEGGKRL